MDINKEREAFEESFKIKWEIGRYILKMVKFIEDSQDYAPVNAVKQMSDEYYWVLALNTGWWAWQAAKAQAVPDTYTPIVLALEDVQSEIAKTSFLTMDGENENEVYAVNANEISTYIDELIEAQEPAND